MIVTSHPLQRIGAYALTCLSHDNLSIPEPETLQSHEFDTAVERMTADAIHAAVGKNTKVPEGFFLKSSLSLFPNSPMFHPSNAKRSPEEIADRVKAWRRKPSNDIDAPCVLCSHPAVGFFGKMDVPLAESNAYRNNTPRGHDGMALCWTCLCSFYAVPYGSHLTGGPCLALHSWDESFLASTVAAQVRHTCQVIEIGATQQRSLRAREVLALNALRRYTHTLKAGVELLVYSNNNRDPTLDIYAIDQELAEWLRRTTLFRPGFRALLNAHRTTKEPGYVGLARTAFRSPERIPGTCASYLVHAKITPRMSADDLAEQSRALATLCFDYANKVLFMDKKDLDVIQATGRRIAVLIQAETRTGKLREFYSKFKNSQQLRSWLQRQSIEWVINPRKDQKEPLVTTRGFELLFDPGYTSQAWFHRQMLLVAVVEELYRQGWRPETDDKDDDIPEIVMADDEYSDNAAEG